MSMTFRAKSWKRAPRRGKGLKGLGFHILAHLGKKSEVAKKMGQ